MTLDFSRCRLPPFQHQREDVAWLLEQPYALIASEMRTGKSKIVVDAAQFLFERGEIDRVIIVAPAPVRNVWYDPDLGEIAKHSWQQIPTKVTEFHSRIRTWTYSDAHNSPLHWYVTNFEFLRSEKQLKQLFEVCGPQTLLIGDESSFLKNWSSQQTKAFVQLRRRCGRCWLLNGTPVFHSPLDLFAQGNILSPKILDCPFITQFKARYAVQQPILGYGGKPLKKVVGKGKFTKEIILQEITGWTNLDDLERRFAPYTVRRLQAECLDLPPKLDPVTLTATLEPATWKAYKQMRDDLVVWLQNDSRVVMSKTAAIKALRLSQITGGFLRGAEDSGIDGFDEQTLDWSEATDGLQRRGSDDPITQATQRHAGTSAQPVEDTVAVCSSEGLTLEGAEEIGREKLDVLLWLIESLLEKDPNLHLVSWSRFRPEVFRAVAAVKEKFPQFQTAVVLGGQKKTERFAALALLKPETSPSGPVFVAGIEGTGSFGLDMTASHTCVTMSSGYSPGRSAQTLDRVYGPGQIHPISYYNIIAVGPRGQRTIDHDILVARMTGENIATRTAAAWVKVLREE